MKKAMKLMACMALMAFATQVNAQGWLKKANEAVDKTTRAIDKGIQNADQQVENIDEVDSTLYLPQFKVTKVVVTDKDGKELVAADGSKMVRYLLVDENGEVRSAKHLFVQAKQAAISVEKIIKNIKNKGWKYALTHAKELKKLAMLTANFIDQQNMLKAYKKNFSEDGIMKDATVDLTKVKGLGDIPELNKTEEDMEKALAAIAAEGGQVEEPDWDSL